MQIDPGRAESAVWKLEDAKAKFSQVVRRARAHGPQLVTVRGRDAVVVMSAEDFRRLSPPAVSKSLWRMFQDMPGRDAMDFEVERVATAPDHREPPSFDE